MQRREFLKAAAMGSAVALIGGPSPTLAKTADYPDHGDLSVYRDPDGQLRPIKTPADWAIRRKHILAGMQEAMGPLPDRTNLPPMDIQVKSKLEGDGFTRLTISFVPEVGDHLTANLYLPTRASGLLKKGTGSESHYVKPDNNSLPRGACPPFQQAASANDRRPAMLALHQTASGGKDDVAAPGGLPNRVYADELAQRGYVVLAPDYPSFGELASYDFAKDRYISGTMKGIFNHMRCVDLLQARPEVDPQRIGAIGHSLGGHNSMFVGVFDERIKVIVSSCGWTPFHDYMKGNLTGWTSDRYMPLLRDKYGLDPNRVPFDFHEVIAALAPRAFFSNSPLKDANFDVAGVRKAVAKARAVYTLLGNPDGLKAIYPDCEHDFPPEARRQAYAFVDKTLKHKPTREVP